MLVPLKLDHKPARRGTDDSTSTPGAVTSGFIRSESGVGPPEEKSAIPSDAVVAATVDGNTGLVSLANAASVYPLLAALPARFRIGDNAKPYGHATSRS